MENFAPAPSNWTHRNYKQPFLVQKQVPENLARLCEQAMLNARFIWPRLYLDGNVDHRFNHSLHTQPHRLICSVIPFLPV